uniref:Uncharacterized protein n=1 Tax=Strigamia maritima TaxID=126957 RepID=T1IT72_STRMM
MFLKIGIQNQDKNIMLLRLFFGLSLLLLISLVHGEEIEASHIRGVTNNVFGIIKIITETVMHK